MMLRTARCRTFQLARWRRRPRRAAARPPSRGRCIQRVAAVSALHVDDGILVGQQLDHLLMAIG